MAAAWAALEAAGRVAREEEGHREARGRWRRSSATRGCQRAANLWPERPGRRRRAALSVDGDEKQSREVGDGDKGDFVISKNSRDYSVNQR